MRLRITQHIDVLIDAGYRVGKEYVVSPSVADSFLARGWAEAIEAPAGIVGEQGPELAVPTVERKVRGRSRAKAA